MATTWRRAKKSSLPLLGVSLLILFSRVSQASLGKQCSQDPVAIQIQDNRRIAELAALGSTYSLGSGYEEAGIYGKDDRIKVDPLAYPFRTVGKLVTNIEIVDKNGKIIGTGNGDCTATLVGNCHLLSARHCIAEQEKIRLPKSAPTDATVRFGKSFFVDALGNKFEVANSETGKGSEFDQDFAFLKIKGAPGKKLGFASFLRQASGYHEVGKVFTAVGYSSDIEGGRYLTADKTTKKVKRSAKSTLLRLRGDWFNGASGGPVFAVADNDVPYIAAIMTRGQAETNSKTGAKEPKHYSDAEKDFLGVTVTTESFATKLRKFIQANPCSQ